MQELIVTIIVVVSVWMHLTIAGFVGAKFKKWREATCKWCHSRHEYCSYDHGSAGFFAGILWPIVIPVCIGQIMGARDPKAERMAARISELERELSINA